MRRTAAHVGAARTNPGDSFDGGSWRCGPGAWTSLWVERETMGLVLALLSLGTDMSAWTGTGLGGDSMQLAGGFLGVDWKFQGRARGRGGGARGKGRSL